MSRLAAAGCSTLEGNMRAKQPDDSTRARGQLHSLRQLSLSFYDCEALAEVGRRDRPPRPPRSRTADFSTEFFFLLQRPSFWGVPPLYF